MALAELALRLYTTQTAQSSEATLPVGTDVVVREGFSVEYRNLPRNTFGYCDADARRLILARELRQIPTKRRLVLMHEFFHAVLGHSEIRECGLADEDEQEAEATYAAVHYLVPIHTFSYVLDSALADPLTDLATVIKAIAATYQVSTDVIMRFVREHGRTIAEPLFEYCSVGRA
jgi:Zn-dependent peptidase ImmA (M78 family)